jgi:drug/metabolite transporter (DMT)-like permease
MSLFRLGLLAALGAAISWGAMFPVLKHLLATLDPYWLTSIRYIGASAIFAILLVTAEGPSAFILDRRAWLLWAVGTAGIAMFNLFVLTGLERSSAEHGALVVATGPALVALILWRRSGKAPARLTLAMLALAFIGVMLVVTKGISPRWPAGRRSATRSSRWASPVSRSTLLTRRFSAITRPCGSLRSALFSEAYRP